MSRIAPSGALIVLLALFAGCSAQAEPPGPAPAPAATTPPAAAAPAPKKPHTALEAYTSYDDKADGAAQIAAAAAQAKASGRRVLVMFGGNWCKWCRALDGLFAGDARVKAALDKGFVLVHVNSDTNLALNDKYGQPFSQGFPVLLVLDADGQKLHVQESGVLEKDDKTVGHDPGRVISFLKHWSPPV